MKNDNGNDRYETGYGKPPRHTRFQKGRSGNPRGRPRGSKNLATQIWTSLLERVTVRENGKVRRITMFEAAVLQSVKRAASGDLRAMKLVAEDLLRLDDGTEEFVARPGLSNEAADALMKALTSGVTLDQNK